MSSVDAVSNKGATDSVGSVYRVCTVELFNTNDDTTIFRRPKTVGSFDHY